MKKKKIRFWKLILETRNSVETRLPSTSFQNEFRDTIGRRTWNSNLETQKKDPVKTKPKARSKPSFLVSFVNELRTKCSQRRPCFSRIIMYTWFYTELTLAEFLTAQVSGGCQKLEFLEFCSLQQFISLSSGSSCLRILFLFFMSRTIVAAEQKPTR